MVRIQIITCPTWGAKRPKQGLRAVGQAGRVIFHHTAGHHRELALPGDESLAEAMQYARDVQAFHMGRGWIDSGHHFLVCRNGAILQGRWLTVSAIEAGHMIEGAHCPGWNGEIGIEHEHKGHEAPTAKQLESSARLQAWIADQYGRTTPLPVDPHSEHYATTCPANLLPHIAEIRARASEILRHEGTK
jgi:hypothetical protein